MKKLIKLIIFTILMLFFLFSFIFTITACTKREEYVEGTFVVSINPEYKNVFCEKRFTIEDFKNEYIESIRYDIWYSNEQEEIGYIYVQLKEQYVECINEVMKSVNELDFVKNVERVPTIQIPETSFVMNI